MGCSPPGSSVHGFLWSGLPFPSPGELPDPGIEPGFPALQADCLPSEPAGKPTVLWRQVELGIGGEQEPLTALREPTFWGEDREWALTRLVPPLLCQFAHPAFQPPTMLDHQASFHLHPWVKPQAWLE